MELFELIFISSVFISVSVCYGYLVLFRKYPVVYFANTVGLGVLVGFGVAASIQFGYLIFIVFLSAPILASYYIIKFLPFSSLHEKYVVLLLVAAVVGFCGSLSCLCCINTL